MEQSYLKKIGATALLVFAGVASSAQVPLDTIRTWNFTSYSAATVDNLTADTQHWTYNSKGRFMNAVETDGLPLTANEVEIDETKGIIVSQGIKAGSFLLRHAMGKDNGMQIEPAGSSITVPDMSKGDEMRITFMSSSKNNRGIQAITNLEGEFGEETYIGPAIREFSFKVIDDGPISFTFSGGVVVTKLYQLRDGDITAEQLPAPEITLTDTPTQVFDVNRQFKTLTLSCPETDATIYYTIIDGKNALEYVQPYVGPVLITRDCTVRAFASKKGKRNSETIAQSVEVPLVLPFAGKPYILDPEPLDRGAVATNATGKYLVNWHLLSTDPEDIRFNVYRNGEKLTPEPIYLTNYMDEGGKFNSVYTLEAISGGQVIEISDVKLLSKGYWDVPLDRPEGGSTKSGKYEYVPGDCMVADVDGDKQYEIIMKWDPTNADADNADSNDKPGGGQKDNSIHSYTGPVFIDAYRLDGTKLWRISLGCNIRAGAHYTQLMVYDLDGDGKAEVACKTAPGTIDGLGNYVILPGDNPDADYRNSNGHVIQGPEYLTVFSGLTGEALATTNYLPARDITSDWGDSYGNRSERYLACVAYLDGSHPSLVMCRGYYTNSYIWAVDFDGKELSTRWLFASERSGLGTFGEGAHSIATADVDGDGCDEIVFGAASVDHDGTLLYRTGLGHGDALHVGDFDPDRNGLEVMMVHENISAKYGIEVRDALTGEVLHGEFAGVDVGRGLIADIDPDRRGCEYWGFDKNVYDINGEMYSTKRPTVNFRTFWDGDVYEEVTERGAIDKWSPTGSKQLLNVTSINAGTNLIKATPNLQADIFGDWREEQIYYSNSNKSHLWIFSTPYATDHRVPCLMHDHHYRMATVWQTTAYNQPPHLSYYLPDYVKSIEAGVDNVTIDSEATVAGYRYFDLSGREINKAPASGFFIRQTIRIDGTTTSEKLAK